MTRGAPRKQESSSGTSPEIDRIDTDAGDPAAELDRVIHERTRLAIMSALAIREPLTFTELKARLDLTDGNLSVHARRLEEAGYLECRKRFQGRVPRTEYVLSAAGKAALSSYIGHMEALIRTMRESVDAPKHDVTTGPAHGAGEPDSPAGGSAMTRDKKKRKTKS